MLHFDKFHFYSPDLIPKVAAWFWLAIYAVVPVAILLALIPQLRLPGTDPPREAPLPTWLRIIFLIQGAGILIVGTALFIVPQVSISIWPWTLTLLTGRAIGAWLIAIGVAALHAVWENDFLRLRPTGGGYTAFGVFQLIALARYPGELDWGVASSWIYPFFVLTILPVGVYSWFGMRRKS